MPLGGLRMHFRQSLGALTLLVGCALPQSSYAFNHDDYQLVYHRSGRTSQGYTYGAYGLRKPVENIVDGLSIFTKGDLIYFVAPNQVTLFNPSEGLLVTLRYDSSGIRKDLDGTKSVDFSRITSTTAIEVWGIGDADVVRTWKQAAANPQQWNAFFSSGPQYPWTQGPLVPGSIIPTAPGNSVFETVESDLGSTSALQAVPGIESKQEWVAGASARENQARAATEALKQAAEARSREIRVEADHRFRRASALPKAIGTTACSSDNRVAYIEQVAGVRVKLTLRGFAVGRMGEFGEYGPYALKVDGAPDSSGNLPIEDPNFLFRPLTKPVQMGNLGGVIWDDSRYWGACDYR